MTNRKLAYIVEDPKPLVLAPTRGGEQVAQTGLFIRGGLSAEGARRVVIWGESHRSTNVRFWHICDIQGLRCDVRFTPQSGSHPSSLARMLVHESEISVQHSFCGPSPMQHKRNIQAKNSTKSAPGVSFLIWRPQVRILPGSPPPFPMSVAKRSAVNH